MIFRIDIQELRAVSIILVFFYHLSSKYVPGGYIGVDVFFVISGFLVSNIYSTQCKGNSTKEFFLFYCKRIKRLFPSSFICLVCYYHYHPTIFKYSTQEIQLYYDIIAALLCCSNIRLYKSTFNYFQNEKSSILINYWSLSLEEQFYILLPFCLYFTNSIVYIYLFFISLFYCILTTYNSDSSSYYLLFSRAWELLLGLIMFKSQISVNVDVKIIVNTIILSSYIIGTFSFFKFPGYIAVIPTSLASTILIQKNNYIYRSKILELLGNMSYVIYLFHYPIIQNNKSWIIIFVKVSIISLLLYYFVEIPTKKINKYKIFIIFTIGLSLIFVIKINNSIKKSKKYQLAIVNSNSYCLTKTVCFNSYIQNLNNYSILLLGDSHLYQYLSIILSILEKYKVGNILFFQVWITNIERNYVSISNLILDMKNISLCIISLYVDYSFLYVQKEKFHIAFLYILEKILLVSKGIIIFQDNPHRVRLNDTYCKKYLLPILNIRRIKYIDIFKEYCKEKRDCINNIYSKSIFSDFHHLKNTFICNNKLINNILNFVIKKFLSTEDRNISLCHNLDLRYKSKYNNQLLLKYNIKPLKKRLKGNVFGLAELPKFSI